MSDNVLRDGSAETSNKKEQSLLSFLLVAPFLMCVVMFVVFYRFFTGEDSWVYFTAAIFLVMSIPCFVGTVFFGSLEQKSTVKEHKVNLALSLVSLGGIIFPMLGAFFPMMVLL